MKIKITFQELNFLSDNYPNMTVKDFIGDYKEFVYAEYANTPELHNIETKEEYFEDNKVLAIDDYLAYKIA